VDFGNADYSPGLKWRPVVAVGSRRSDRYEDAPKAPAADARVSGISTSMSAATSLRAISPWLEGWFCPANRGTYALVTRRTRADGREARVSPE